MDKNSNGFIKLNRKLIDSWIFENPLYSHWFIFILYQANWKDNNRVVFNGKFTTVKRGEFITSYRKLAATLPNCSVQRIRTFLKLLEKADTIKLTSTQGVTHISICNYANYQDSQHSKQQSENKSKTVAKKDVEKQKKTEKNKRSKDNLEQRKADFKGKIKSLAPSKMTNDDKNKFYNYWTEHNDSGFTMRFEKQATFNTKQRMETWLGYSSKNSKGKKINNFSLD